jgi:hypothetical protein
MAAVGRNGSLAYGRHGVVRSRVAGGELDAGLVVEMSQVALDVAGVVGIDDGDGLAAAVARNRAVETDLVNSTVRD